MITETYIIYYKYLKCIIMYNIVLDVERTVAYRLNTPSNELRSNLDQW